jgi:hypothetical protein
MLLRTKPLTVRSECAANAQPLAKVSGMRLFIAKEYTGWRADVLAALSRHLTDNGKSFSNSTEATAAALEAAAAHADFKDANEKSVKAMSMPFVKFKMAEVSVSGGQVRLTPPAISFVALVGTPFRIWGSQMQRGLSGLRA